MNGCAITKKNVLRFLRSLVSEKNPFVTIGANTLARRMTINVYSGQRYSQPEERHVNRARAVLDSLVRAGWVLRLADNYTLLKERINPKLERPENGVSSEPSGGQDAGTDGGSS